VHRSDFLILSDATPIPLSKKVKNKKNINDFQARSSLYANTQLHAHWRAEKNNKEQKK
jgi:hypothetical protein